MEEETIFRYFLFDKKDNPGEVTIRSIRGDHFYLKASIASDANEDINIFQQYHSQ